MGITNIGEVAAFSVNGDPSVTFEVNGQTYSLVEGYQGDRVHIWGTYPGENEIDRIGEVNGTNLAAAVEALRCGDSRMVQSVLHRISNPL